MEERKSLRELSLDITEEAYREDPALSYSVLARYERGGFGSLSSLMEKQETPSLTFGSAVDTLITGSREEFDSKFMSAYMPPLSDALVTLVRELFKRHHGEYNDIKDIPDNLIADVLKESKWNQHWRMQTRVSKLKDDGSKYYRLLYVADGRTVLDYETWCDVMNTYDALIAMKIPYFRVTDMFDTDTERLYQLKFKAFLEDVEYKCMADLLIVRHNEKRVIPVDLKTSSKPEYDFPKSFLEWRYDIQARLYWLVIRDNMDRDPYYKDFTLDNYRFVVANRKSLKPLSWLFEETVMRGDIISSDGTVLRDPMTIGKELRRYLDDKPSLPDGIYNDKPNTLRI